MLDIIVGITDEEVAKARALASIPADRDWLNLYVIKDASSLFDLRKRSITTGTNDWITFLDQGDEYISVDRLKAAIESAKRGAVFTNSYVVTPGLTRLRHASSFVYQGRRTIATGVVPHRPLILRREIAKNAFDNAFDRILSKDGRFLNLVDLALACEVELLIGWSYYSAPSYRWYTDPAVNAGETEARTEMLRVYKKLMT